MSGPPGQPCSGDDDATRLIPVDGFEGLVDRHECGLGRVVALDRKTGRRLWQLICPLDEVSGVDLVGDTLMVVGTNGAQTDVVSGHVLLLDPATGEPRLPMLEERSPIAWSSLGVEGNLVPPQDVIALADALSALVNDPARRAQMAAAGRLRAEDYSWPRITARLLAYYERLRDARGAVGIARTRERAAAWHA